LKTPSGVASSCVGKDLAKLQKAFYRKSALLRAKKTSMANLNTWKQQHIVAEYAAATELQPPEKAILERLGEQLHRMKMLDISFGGGRTTIHFAAAAEEYWGIDYSEEMIAACRNRFQNGSSRIRFGRL
jgi:SAM-dependent methyltransferase